MRGLRYLLSRFFLVAMGLSVTKWRKEVQALWTLPDNERLKRLENELKINRPLNARGDEVPSLDQLYDSPPLSKKALREQSDNKNNMSRRWGFNRHTAGTTGEPTHIMVSRKELGRMLAVRDYCFSHYGIRLGQREARLWGRPESGAKPRLKNYLMNRRVFHPVGSNARQEVISLMKWRPDYVYGYTSLLLEAAKIMDNIGLKIVPPKCVVCTAETILPAQKAYIARVFKAPVAEEYGSTEFDVIAFECREGHRHLVNPWLMVDENEGLISDVSRTTQDLIKYQLGDSFIISNSSCQSLGSVNFIEQLQGRTLDRFFYLTETQKIHATTFSHIFDQYFSETSDIFSFSLSQTAYSILEVSVDSIPVNGIEDLRCYLERKAGSIAGVRVSVVVSFFPNRNASAKRNYFEQKITAWEAEI